MSKGAEEHVPARRDHITGEGEQERVAEEIHRGRERRREPREVQRGDEVGPEVHGLVVEREYGGDGLEKGAVVTPVARDDPRLSKRLRYFVDVVSPRPSNVMQSFQGFAHLLEAAAHVAQAGNHYHGWCL